jgi:hypothetical protein
MRGGGDMNGIEAGGCRQLDIRRMRRSLEEVHGRGLENSPAVPPIVPPKDI